MLKIEKAGVRDIPVIWQTELRSFEYPLEHAALEETIQTCLGVPYIGYIGRRAADVWCLVNYYKETKELAIRRIATYPAFRRKGFAKMMLSYLWKEGLKLSAEKMSIIVPEYQMDMEDPDSLNMFLWRCGFKSVKLEKDYFLRYGRMYDGVVLERGIT